MAKVEYREGDWFAGPLRDHGYAMGVLARAKSSGVLLGYFFGPRLAEVPFLDAAAGLNRHDAVLVGKFGHLGVKRGTWPILGRLAEWDRQEWPTPVFIRDEELTGRWFRAHYDDNHPNKLLGEERHLRAIADQPMGSWALDSSS